MSRLFKAANFIAGLTVHIPPKHKYLIRYYGPYSSRTKGKATKDGRLAKFGYTPATKKIIDQASDLGMEIVSNKASRRSRVRLIQKLYKVDPLVCPKCSPEMKITAIITEPGECKHTREVSKILECLKRNHAPPFDKVVTKAS